MNNYKQLVGLPNERELQERLWEKYTQNIAIYSSRRLLPLLWQAAAAGPADHGNAIASQRNWIIEWANWSWLAYGI